MIHQIRLPRGVHASARCAAQRQRGSRSMIRFVGVAKLAMTVIFAIGCEKSKDETIVVETTKTPVDRLYIEADVTRGDGGVVTAIDLRDRAFDPSLIESMLTCEKVKSVKLNGKQTDQMTIESVRHLGSLPNLKVLAVDGIRLPDEAIRSLQNAANYVEFYASRAGLDDSSAADVRLMPRLKKLRLAGNAIGELALKSIGDLDQIVELDLSSCETVGDGNLDSLSSLGQLKKLNLYETSVVDGDLKVIGEIQSLEWLNLDKTKLTDAGVESLTRLPKLRWLHLGSTAISDASAETLAKLSSLETLIVTRTEMTEDGVATIREALPQTEIQLQYQPK